MSVPIEYQKTAGIGASVDSEVLVRLTMFYSARPVQNTTNRENGDACLNHDMRTSVEVALYLLSLTFRSLMDGARTIPFDPG